MTVESVLDSENSFQKWLNAGHALIIEQQMPHSRGTVQLLL
jgi:hypothetical protein